MRQIHGLLNTGYRDVVDADLADYFGSIPHAELMSSVARRVNDRHMLHLIKQWMVVPVEEEDGSNPRPRSKVHVTRPMVPITARPRIGSSAGFQGASVKVSCLRMTS